MLFVSDGLGEGFCAARRASAAAVREQPRGKDRVMTYGKERVYKKVEVIGVSPNSIDEAIKVALHRAHHSLERISWFEVEEVRGHVNEAGEVGEYQVVPKVAFNLK
jgi:flavin-binding protein dodecin